MSFPTSYSNIIFKTHLSIRYEGGDSNLYGYVLNDPINFIDPWGLATWAYDSNNGVLSGTDDNGNGIGSWGGVSGTTYRGGIRQQLPNGEYAIGNPVVIANTPANAAYCDTNGNCWWTPLSPNFQTNRTGLGIHPDGNVPGTEGCIGITGDNTGDLFDSLRNNPGILTLF